MFVPVHLLRLLATELIITIMPPTTNLTFGQTSDEVKKLQNFLIAQGYTISAGATGYFGTQTRDALKSWQQKVGVGGPAADLGNNWGALSMAKASGTTSTSMSTSDVKALQDSLVKMGLMTQAEVNTGYGIYGPKTTAAAGKLAGIKTQMESDIVREANNNKVLNPKKEGETTPTIKYKTYADMLAGEGGGTTDQYGQPFSNADQQAALRAAEAAGQGAFDEQKRKDQQDAEATLANQKTQYEAYLNKSQSDFQGDKTKLDQSAADQGVLFSGGRVQKLNNLKSSYEADQAGKLSSLGYNTGNTARDFQYKYGNNAAGPLSQYYQAGSNAYNPNVATGGATSGGLSSIYSPSSSDFYGTEVKKQKVNANQYAAGLLWNKGNKIVPGGYQNKY